MLKCHAFITYVGVKYNEHTRPAGHYLTDIIIRQQDISGLSCKDNVVIAG
jgi:hypothetical protein